jgi:hypothetical protein
VVSNTGASHAFRLIVVLLALLGSASVSVTQSAAFGVRPSGGEDDAGAQSVFYRTPLGQLGVASYNPSASVIPTPAAYGYAGDVVGNPASVIAPSGDRYVYYRKANGQLGAWWISANGAQWHNSAYGEEGSVTGDPSVVRAANGTRYVYYRSSTGQLASWKIPADGPATADGYGHHGTVAGNPVAVITSAGDRFVYYRHSNGQLGSWWLAANDTDWNPIDWGRENNVEGDPAVGLSASGARYVYHRTATGQLGRWWFPATGSEWNYSGYGYEGALRGSPSVAVTPTGDSYVYYRSSTGQLGTWWIGADSGWNNSGYGHNGTVASDPSTVSTETGHRFTWYASSTGQLRFWHTWDANYNEAAVGSTGALTVLADEYGTSWDFGGLNASIDTEAEADEAIRAFLRGSDGDAMKVWNAIAPGDREYADRRLRGRLTNGTLARDAATQTIWFIEGGERRLVPSREIAVAVGINVESVVRSVTGALAGIPRGSDVAPAPAPTPAEQAVVAQAIAAGDTAVEALIAPGGAASTQAGVARALLARSTSRQDTGSDNGAQAGGTNCAGGRWQRSGNRVLGVWLFYGEVRTSGWCYKNGKFTSYGKNTTHSVASGPYCWNGPAAIIDEWLDYPTKRTIGMDRQIGIGKGGVCIGHPRVVRPRININANGTSRGYAAD